MIFNCTIKLAAIKTICKIGILMAWEYSDKLKELFSSVLKGGAGSFTGKISDADGVGQHGSIACGDAILFSFKTEIDPDHPNDPLKERIIQARYLTFGCTSAIASSEALCYLIEERRPTPVEALKISSEEIVSFLSGMPKAKIHCSIMGAEVLRAALLDWALKRSISIDEYLTLPGDHFHEEGKIVCNCFHATDIFIKNEIKKIAPNSIEEILEKIKVGSACGKCLSEPGGIFDLWEREPGKKKLNHSESEITLKERVNLIFREVLEPEFSKMGLSVQLIGLKNRTLFYSLTLTEFHNQSKIESLVERLIHEAVDPSICCCHL